MDAKEIQRLSKALESAESLRGQLEMCYDVGIDGVDQTVKDLKTALRRIIAGED